MPDVVVPAPVAFAVGVVVMMVAEVVVAAMPEAAVSGVTVEAVVPPTAAVVVVGTALVVAGTAVAPVPLVGVVLAVVVVTGVVVMGVVVMGVVLTGVVDTVVVGIALPVVPALPVPVPDAAAAAGVNSDGTPMFTQEVPSSESTSPGGQMPSDTKRFTCTPDWANAEAEVKPSADAAADSAMREWIECMMSLLEDVSSCDPSRCFEFCR